MNRYSRHTGMGYCRPRTQLRERCGSEAGETCQPAPTCEAAEEQAPTLAMAYVPAQIFRNLLEPHDALHQGSIFAELIKPYEGGCCR